MTEGAPALAVRGLLAGYGDMQVLRGVSLDVGAGEIVALVGPNGAGKSTLMKALAGLIAPAGGEILLSGEALQALPPWTRVARGLVLVPESLGLFAPLSVRENLALGAFSAPGDEARRLEAVFGLFPSLADRRRARAETLSGGLRRMLALARGLMARPRLLCLDDPFLGLTREVTDRVCGILRAAAADGTAVLVAGQHVRRLLALADRACLLEEGRVTLEGRGRELIEDPRLRRALLEGEAGPA